VLEEGEADGAATWRLIVKRINELLQVPEGAAH
jgi:hypothetical protein